MNKHEEFVKSIENYLDEYRDDGFQFTDLEKAQIYGEMDRILEYEPILTDLEALKLHIENCPISIHRDELVSPIGVSHDEQIKWFRKLLELAEVTWR